MDMEDDPHFSFIDDFEEEMDNFWKDEDPNKAPSGEESDYLESEEETSLRLPTSHHCIDMEEEEETLEAEDEDAIDRILAEEEAELLKENGLEDAVKEEAVKEKIILDRLNVEKLINMLSKVRLAWPEDMPYYDANEYSTDPE
jgi:hypothetical protein